MKTAKILESPVNRELLLHSALERIRQLEIELTQLREEVIRPEPGIRIPQGHRMIAALAKDVIYIRAVDNCSQVTLRNGKNYFVCRTLKSWAAELSASDFIRCHRTFLVNRKEILEIDRRTQQIVLHNQICIPTSRRFQKNGLTLLFPKEMQPTSPFTIRHLIPPQNLQTMKPLFVFCLCLLFHLTINAQRVGINDDASIPDASAMLDVKSIQRGFLLPRMTEAQRLAIVSPATSLIVYQTDATRGFYFYDGSGWSKISAGDTGWKVDGNSGTQDGVNFMGTTDNQPICFRVNNIAAGRISTDGIALGYHAGLNNTMIGNTIVGTDAFMSNTSGVYNVAVGTNALQDNTDGGGNIAIGTSALANNTSGYMNTAIGMESAVNNLTGAENTAYGSLSLHSNTAGSNLLAVGRLAAFSNTTGNNNTVIGYGAGKNNSTANEETYIGYEAGYNTTSNKDQFNIAYPNTYVGYKAGRANTAGYGNSFIGYESGWLNSTGNANTALGFQSLNSNTTGHDNTAVGYSSMESNTTGSNNVALGSETLNHNSTGQENTAVGWRSLYYNSTGGNNTAIGFASLFQNSTGSGNTAIGTDVMGALNTGDDNTAVGFNALAQNTTGESNTCVGRFAMAGNTSGYSNVGIGVSAMEFNTSGNYNIGIGEYALRGNTVGMGNVAVGWAALISCSNSVRNTAIGYVSMNHTTTGTDNVGLGYSSLTNNTTGSRNTALGSFALEWNTGGIQNTAVGNSALEKNTTGDVNTVVGAYALDDNTTGSGNTAIGGSALGANTTGADNTAIGLGTLLSNSAGNDNVAIGRAGLLNTTTGDNNISLGFNAGQFNSTGNNNIFIGANSDANALALSNATAIGYGAVVGASNSLVLGGTGSNQVKVGIGTSTPLADMDVKQDDPSGNERGLKLERQDNTDDWRIYAGSTSDSDLAFALNNTIMGVIDGTTGNYVPSSDMRLKQDITPMSNVLDKVMQLQPKSYTFIDHPSEKKALGFIAQEVEPVFPEIVNEREDGYKGLAYDEFAVIAIQAIKEQQALIQQQQTVINNLLQRVEALEHN